MGTIFFRSDSDKWGQGLKWGQYAVPPIAHLHKNVFKNEQTLSTLTVIAEGERFGPNNFYNFTPP